MRQPPLCPRHHHLVHDQNWALELDHHRTLTISNQHGEIHAVVPLDATTPSIIDGTNRPEPTSGQPPPSPDGSKPPPDESPPGRPPDQLSLIA